MNKRIFYLVLIALMVAISIYFSIIADADVISDLKNHKNPILTLEEQRWLKEQGSLIYAADNHAPPLRFVDAADNQYKGVVVDYINLLSLELGVNIELHPLLWQDALKSLEEGKSDICDMFRSKERSKHFLFTNPIYNLRAVLVVNSNHRGTSSLESMVLATQKGDYVNEYLINTYPGIKIIQVDNVCSALDLLLDGKVDAVAGDEPVVLYQIKNKNAESTLHIKETPLYEEEVVFAVPKSKPQLVTIINKGIAALNDTNQLERIQQKWFGISAPIVQLPDYSTRIKYILVIAGFLMMIVVGMVTWNYFLKQEVERRTKELLDSKHDLQITFDGMTEYIAVTDLDLKIVNINKSFLDCLGYSQSQVLNRHCREIFKHFNSVNIESMIADTIASGDNLEEEITNMGNYYVVRTYPLKDTRGSMMAPVSDTTICSATSQGVDVPGVVKSRLKYALTAAGITVVGIIIFGMMYSGYTGVVGTIDYNSTALIMLVPVAITIWMAVKTGDIIIATTFGTVLAGLTAVFAGLIDFIQIDPGQEVTKKALFRVVGEGLDRTVDGVIYTGINSMIQVVILAILLFGSIAIMRAGQGDAKLLEAIGKIAQGPKGAEFSISGMTIILSSLMGLNAPAILAVGASFAKPLSKKHGISPYRTANLLDATSCTLVYSLPWTPAIIYTIGFTRDGIHPLTAMEVTPFVFYAFAMLAVMFGSILLGIGRDDNMDSKDIKKGQTA